MNLNDTARLLAVIQVGDNRVIDELTVQEWHHAVADLRIADAVEAVREHRRTSTAYLVPQHVRAGVARLRAGRLDAADLPEPPAEVADDPAAWLRWKRATLAAIADGTYVPPPPPQLVRRPAILRAIGSTFRQVRHTGKGAA